MTKDKGTENSNGIIAPKIGIKISFNFSLTLAKIVIVAN